MIRFTVTENNTKHVIETYEGSYRNLMLLLKDKLYLLDDFGECGGMGRCATCQITAVGITGNSNIQDRNEPATLQKNGIDDEKIRLSCQLYITNDLDGAEIEILEY